MASDSNSANFDGSLPSNWLANLSGVNPVTLDQALLRKIAPDPTLPFPPLEPLHQHETFSVNNHPNAQSTDANDGSEIHTVALPAPPPPPLPSPQLAATLPPRRLEIPQKAYKTKRWDYRPSEPIHFNGKGFRGLNMYDALQEKFADLEGRDDPVLQVGKKAVTCRFLFPGYPQGSFQIFTTYWNKDRDPIVRSKLAHEVARGLERYVRDMAMHAMDTSTDQQWKIGEGFMHFENIFLAELKPISTGSYQPLFFVMA